MIGECPVPCHERLGCSSCLGQPGRCTWCEATQTCFIFSSYTSLYQFGLCREWVDVEPVGQQTEAVGLPGRSHHTDPLLVSGTGKSLLGTLSVVTNNSRIIDSGTVPISSAGRCKACERKQSCSSCLADLGCGWCYFNQNPMIGLCKAGDFRSPAAGKFDLYWYTVHFSIV